MSTVTLTIGPKTYNVACADGEEAHIAALGAMIAEKYAQLGAARAPLEAQNLLFSALFLADELAEARKRIDGVEQTDIALAAAKAEIDRLRGDNERLASQLTEARAARPTEAAPADAAAINAGFAEAIEALAARAEAAAAALEADPANA